MLNFPSSNLDKKIIEILSFGPLSSRKLIEKLREDGFKISFQGVYKSISKLRKDSVIVVYKKEVSISQVWLREMESFIMTSKYVHRDLPSSSGHFLQMNNGDKISYFFRNTVQVDIFWNHVLYTLFDAFPKEKRWFAYSSHCWFLLARSKDELALRDHMISKGIMYIFTVGNKTALDKYVSKYFDGSMSKYHMFDKPLFANKKDNLGIGLTIFSDYIIEVKYDQQTTTQIESFYKKYSKLNDDNQHELQSIISNQSHTKFTIIKDNERASKLVRLLEKPFYFEKKLLS